MPSTSRTSRALLSAALLVSAVSGAGAQATGAMIAVRPASGAASSMQVDSIALGSAPMRVPRAGSIAAPASDAAVTVSFVGPGTVSTAFASTMTQAQKQHLNIREIVLTVPGKATTERLSLVDCAVESFYVRSGTSKLVVRPTHIIASESSSTSAKPQTGFDVKTHN